MTLLGSRPLLVVGLLLVSASCASDQGRPPIPPGADPLRWEPAIRRFEAGDREAPPPRDGVVFVGSSSIRLWKTLHADMAPLPTVNRGFGGSRLFDVIYYCDQLVSAHTPRLVVVFCGTNDIAGDRPRSAEEVRDLVAQLVTRLRERQPRLTICYIAITPTLARRRHIPTVRAANRLIEESCEGDPRLVYIDTASALMDEDGMPDPKWFVADRLHLNEAGYAVWSSRIKPVVSELFHGRRPLHRGTPR